MYIWIAIGEVSSLPVFASDKRYPMQHWLRTRRSVDHVRLFRWGGPKGMIEVCIPCFLDPGNKPAKERGH
jgi:hypothetical protein